MSNFIKTLFGDYIENLYNESCNDIKCIFENLNQVKLQNEYKVLKAFKDNKISDSHFKTTTGYAYTDLGRDGIENLYKDIFGTQSALVRLQFVNGTHAIGCALLGNLSKGDILFSITGQPYDTIKNIIGLNNVNEQKGSLKDLGVSYLECNLKDDGNFDIENIIEILNKNRNIKIIYIQRSRGYSLRKSLLPNDIKDIVKIIKSVDKNLCVFVDNCYGEFTDIIEPTNIGVDLMAGSLIKNIGGGLTPTGGYIVGNTDLIKNAAYRLTVPGIGGECGASLTDLRQVFQGLFIAPHIVVEAMKTAIFTARIFEKLGYDVYPKYDVKRGDIIQAIKLNTSDELINFCKEIQKNSPVDSFLECEPWDMPGYNDQVIMAAGTFISGSSIELSCDAPIREPYVAYLQGSLTFEHGQLAILNSIKKLTQK
ncbi:aluminum resistance protein [Candidatus Arthromitus sp. SFB-mouse-Japan]|uniref:methionine gamma-lyase family protein n=1 Tax=Candidatus Arthromitus sp. SFB-mouse TaxID=49118 RepID=UPI00021B7C7F|nr:methionine gamma-lyase family protein [Candidatus Arthromitus sp. SFB-mouse]EGX28789.1 aluminum resistance protein [Candidatus Arthromitus sp. SFB-mouse-NYU]BAK56521.1 aluminum resistance protein [Candidatus Arthromitus sp. SFB-mouse-Japan]BAK79851.1 aluminium resistance protein [Candidatus Arthromitus sp. SFB-mouse-Yit]